MPSNAVRVCDLCHSPPDAAVRLCASSKPAPSGRRDMQQSLASWAIAFYLRSYQRKARPDMSDGSEAALRPPGEARAARSAKLAREGRTGGGRPPKRRSFPDPENTYMKSAILLAPQSARSGGESAECAGEGSLAALPYVRERPARVDFRAENPPQGLETIDSAPGNPASPELLARSYGLREPEGERARPEARSEPVRARRAVDGRPENPPQGLENIDSAPGNPASHELLARGYGLREPEGKRAQPEAWSEPIRARRAVDVRPENPPQGLETIDFAPGNPASPPALGRGCGLREPEGERTQPNSRRKRVGARGAVDSRPQNPPQGFENIDTAPGNRSPKRRRLQ